MVGGFVNGTAIPTGHELSSNIEKNKRPTSRPARFKLGKRMWIGKIAASMHSRNVQKYPDLVSINKNSTKTYSWNVTRTDACNVPMFQTCSYLETIIRPTTKFQNTGLLVERKILNVYFTGRLVYRRGLPFDEALMIDGCLGG